MTRKRMQASAGPLSTAGILRVFLCSLALAALLFGCAITDSDSRPVNNADGDGDSPSDGDRTDATIGCLSDKSCPSGSACDPYRFVCREFECSDTADCEDAKGEAYTCTSSGLCVARRCAAPEDCPDSHYCSGGLCSPIPDCTQIADLAITPVTPYLRKGGTRELNAYVTDIRGRVIPAEVNLTWRSLNPDVISVQPYPDNSFRAQASGGETFGTTSLVATLNFDDEACSASEFSATVSLQNFPVNESGLRVLVVDQTTDALVGGATVVVNDQIVLTSTEGDKGVAMFTNIEPPFDVHIFHDNYNYLSLIQVNTRDILAPIRPFYGQNQAAGLAATVNYDSIPDVRYDEAQFALMGMSFTRSLLDLHIGSLFASPLLTPMSFSGPFHDELPMPANVKVAQTGAESALPLLATGNLDSSVAWTLGGYLPDDVLLELVTERINGGWTDIGSFLLTALSFSGSYYFGMQTDLAVSPKPMVPDNGEHLNAPLNVPDVNGDGNETDYIPDYDTFTALESPLALTQTLNQQLTLTAGLMPYYGSQRLDGLFALVGKRLDGRQFIPLGLATRYISPDTLADKASASQGGELRINFAPLNGGDLRSDDYVVAAYATPFEAMFSRNVSRQSYSAILYHSDVSPRNVQMGDFLQFVWWADVFEDERRVEFIPVEGANLHRISFCDNGRDWEILIDGSTDNGSKRQVVLPTPPGHDPFGLELAVTAATFYYISDGQTDSEQQVSTSLDDLAEFNAKPLWWLDRYVKRYSLYHFDQRRR